MRIFVTTCLLLGLAACGTAYQSPKVRAGLDDGTRVRVVPMTGETTLLANRSNYRPRALPPVFSTGAGTGGGLRSGGAAPSPVFDAVPPPARLISDPPPPVGDLAYEIGVGDVLLLATPRAADPIEANTGQLAVHGAGQGYAVQDDGAMHVPGVGRVRVVGMTMEQAEAELFQRFVNNNVEPTFSLEIGEFNSQKVTVGGAVAKPAVLPISHTPLHLDQALAAAGGVVGPGREHVSIRIYRSGRLYQIPLGEFETRSGSRRLRLIDGDSVFVDTGYDLERAQAYFEQQISLAGFRSQQRREALSALATEVGIRRDALNEARQTYLARAELGATKRDYVYLTGEVGRQSRFPLPFEQQATLADALFEGAGGIPLETGNVREIYVLRASPDPREFGAVTAWHLDGRNAANFTVAAQFQLRPNDVIFVAEQPVTRWNRVVRQITPSLIATGARAAVN